MSGSPLKDKIPQHCNYLITRFVTLPKVNDMYLLKMAHAAASQPELYRSKSECRSRSRRKSITWPSPHVNCLGLCVWSVFSRAVYKILLTKEPKSCTFLIQPIRKIALVLGSSTNICKNANLSCCETQPPYYIQSDKPKQSVHKRHTLTMRRSEQSHYYDNYSRYVKIHQSDKISQLTMIHFVVAER